MLRPHAEIKKEKTLDLTRQEQVLDDQRGGGGVNRLKQGMLSFAYGATGAVA